MAAKKTTSQAEKAASQAKRKGTPSGKSTGSKGGNPQKDAAQTEIINQLPIRVIVSLVSLVLFIVFLVMCWKPDGAVLKIFYGFVLGLIGKVGFYVSIPALLYLFVIQAFSGRHPVLMRSICLMVFVLMCGCVTHLVLNPKDLGTGFGVLATLYTGGVQGTTGGLICGGIAMLTKMLLGSVLPYFVFCITGVLTLLASIQITIPSLIRAIKNRPRADWETEKERKEQQEPAAVVVNHIANKRIEYVQRRREQKTEKVNIDIPLDGESVQKSMQSGQTSRASDLMRQIDSDVEAPVAAAGKAVEADGEDMHLTAGQELPPEGIPQKPGTTGQTEIAEKPDKAEETDDFYRNMPPLVLEQPEEKLPEKRAPEMEAVTPPPLETATKKVSAKEAQESAAQVAQEIALTETAPKQEYCFPPLELLRNPQNGASDGTEEMRENTRRLNETLESFRIEAHIINVTRGPSVTRYEVELDKGVRLNKLTSCADDIALSLGASGVRIAAVPGKISVVGIEVPNRSVTTVSLREVIGSNEFKKAKSKSSFAVGKDIGGSCIVGNIAKLPHMLIAGTTGSGKSVCMNSIIISLLYKASPDDVKLIMVDPKMVELGIYNGIPHLLIPVVTDPKKAAGSLQWAVTEMMRRYKAMSDAGVRDLESYNSIIESQEEDGAKLPQVVVIIDELADLMLVAAKEVEESICRIAQMGRAAGIHLIIATQRPSADVITGLMKANIPSRIAFAVASAMESRIILDTQGAEKLVGKGDMLYAPIGCGKPKRVQGCFVSDPEVEAVASYVKNNFNVDYDQQVMDEIERKAAQTGNKPPATDPEPNEEELAGDEMLPAAVDVILETGQASVSMLQRRLKLGYARAARIVDEMEERGIVGPFKGSKPREILVTKEQWQAMQGDEPSQMTFQELPEDPEEEGNEEDFT